MSRSTLLYFLCFVVPFAIVALVAWSLVNEM